MEKFLAKAKPDEINRYLADGWKVKMFSFVGIKVPLGLLELDMFSFFCCKQFIKGFQGAKHDAPPLGFLPFLAYRTSPIPI